MKFNREKFFSGFRESLDDSVEQEQVDGLEFLLGEMEKEPLWRDLRHIAYALATVFHETAGSFQPVEEGYYLGSKAKAFQKKLRYFPWFGRGYVQLTWETNYKKADKEIRKQRPDLVERFEAETGKKFDLLKDPSQTMHPLISYVILTLGMHQGWFTGKKLSDYISDTGKDYKNARRIINLLDKAVLIANYAKTFESILRASKTNSAAVSTSAPSAVGPQSSALPSASTQPPEFTEGERPTTQVIVEKGDANLEAPKPAPQGDPVTVKTERTSIWTKIAVGIAAITGMGINVGNFVNTKLNEMEMRQLGYVLAGVGLIAVALWAYDRAQSRAHAKTLAKVDTASDPSKNTVRLER